MSNPILGMMFCDPGDGAWPDLVGKEIIHATTIAVAVLPDGMRTGKPSVSIRIDLENGQHVIAETSLALLLTCADSARARYGDPRTGAAADYKLAAALDALADEDQLRDRLAELLEQTANALKGPPPANTLHDWSDLPKVAAELKARADG